ncbi:MAG: hypothetical protein LBO79_11325 [Zoogloeaceae bacterium]|jgi:hypothetical protein|nr:hypothetical protein [Zoogloeaceae bacterium]
MSTFNPEFRRHLWLELSLPRLILMPMLIALSWLCIVVAFGGFGEEQLRQKILAFSLFGFTTVTILWGSVQAYNSVYREFAEGTWDGQRMSALTPWQMAWGKLLGATVFTWYGGILLLAIAGASAHQLGYPNPDIFLYGTGTICVTVFMHALAMMYALLACRRKPDGGARFGIGGVLSMVLLLGLFQTFYFSSGNTFGSHMTWWHHDWLARKFVVCSLLALAVWALTGLWLFMRAELLSRNAIWWWPFFLVFWMIWGAGFVREYEEWFGFFSVCDGLIWIGVYVLLLTGRKDQSAWLRLIAAYRREDKALTLRLLPYWLRNLVIAIGVGIVAICFGPEASFWRHTLILLSICLFVLRDVAVILWINLAPNPRRADGMMLVFLFVAYGLLPFLTDHTWRDFTLALLPPFMDILRHVHDPGITPKVVKSLVAALVQAMLALYLFRNRWTAVFGRREEMNGKQQKMARSA